MTYRKKCSRFRIGLFCSGDSNRNTSSIIHTVRTHHLSVVYCLSISIYLRTIVDLVYALLNSLCRHHSAFYQPHGIPGRRQEEYLIWELLNIACHATLALPDICALCQRQWSDKRDIRGCRLKKNRTEPHSLYFIYQIIWIYPIRNLFMRWRFMVSDKIPQS